MGSDATEAALGLLGLTAATFDTVPTVPLKRKQSPSSSPRHQQATSTSAGSDTISCICGFTYDDGFSIGCDSCSRWCHAACFGIVESEVPEEWQCWVCSPRPVDKERAIRVQKARQRSALSHEAEKQRRRMSPGVDRKGRKTSGPTADGGGHTKRKRRVSTTTAPSHEDEHVDIDEPWALSYVHINQDTIPHDETRDRLRRVATRWRGVTALKPSTSEPTTPAILDPGDFQPSPLINLRPLSSSSYLPSISANLDPSVRPPSYAAHTVRAVPSSGMITPYTSTITPSTAYLADPLNAYAHLSMPKPFVHLIGPPLDVALDSRTSGNLGRFVRSGCRPNAVLRPVLCPRGKSRATAPNDTDDDDRETLTFGVFALRDLKAHEEVVLGWEWDDGSVVHQLPALIDSPHIFPPHELQHLRHQLINMLHALSSTFTTSSIARSHLLRHLRLPHLLRPKASYGAPPGERSRVHSGGSEGAHKKRANLGPLIGVERGFRTRERVPWSGGLGGVEMVSSSPTLHNDKSPHDIFADQVLNAALDRKGKSKATDADYTQWEAKTMSAPDVDEDSPPTPPEVNLPPKLRKRWIRKTSDSLRASHPSSDHEPHIGVISEATAKTGQVQSDSKPDELMQVDEPAPDPAAAAMPPPPLPPRLAALSPRTLSSIALPNASVFPGPNDTLSPSSHFANLSLLSPVTYGPSPYFAVNAARRNSTSPTPTPPPPPPPVQLAHSPDRPPEQNHAIHREREENSPPILSRRRPRSTEPAAPSTVEVEVHSTLRESPSLDSGSVPTPEQPLSLSVSAEPDVTDPVSPSHPAPELTEEPVPMDVSADHPANAGVHDSHDVAMSSPSVTSTRLPEEHPAPPPETISVEEPPTAKRTPSPPPRPPSPPKVKMSLKDFALRKKKKREQEANKVVTERSSVAPSDASSLPNTPAGQPATLVESPAAMSMPLAQASESPSANTVAAPSHHEAAFNVVAPTTDDKQRMTSEQIPAESVKEPVNNAQAQDIRARESHGLKLEMMESSVPPEPRMSNGHPRSPSPKPHEASVYATETEAEPAAKPRSLLRRESLRSPSRDRSPRESIYRTPKASTPRPEQAPSSDGAHEDGEIGSRPAVRSATRHYRIHYRPTATSPSGPPCPSRPARHAVFIAVLEADGRCGTIIAEGPVGGPGQDGVGEGEGEGVGAVDEGTGERQ
ncbi:hypothetical protein EVJ58_g7370 [Rhodofomes roseus]|uniref:PHD-type domain-containing protein n=1 Tax=Rhodofomes roseus TaxID=34475 RepID=A0A4Y9Y613_9APHY|nr:hypothetical protein EVJ58_g7370 [Rhodofomes roseus]